MKALLSTTVLAATLCTSTVFATEMDTRRYYADIESAQLDNGAHVTFQGNVVTVVLKAHGEEMALRGTRVAGQPDVILRPLDDTTDTTWDLKVEETQIALSLTYCNPNEGMAVDCTLAIGETTVLKRLDQRLIAEDRKPEQPEPVI